MRFLHALIISSLCLISAIVIRKGALLLLNSGSLNHKNDKIICLSNKQRKIFKVRNKCISKKCLAMLYESSFFFIAFPIFLAVFLIVGENRLLIRSYYFIILLNLVIKTFFVILKMNR